MHVLLDIFQAVTNVFMGIPFWTVRRLYLSLFAKLQEGCFIAYKCDIRFPKKLSIGKNSVVNKCCTLDCRGGSILIGDNVDIAQETNLWTLEHDVSAHDHGTKGGGYCDRASCLDCVKGNNIAMRSHRIRCGYCQWRGSDKKYSCNGNMGRGSRKKNWGAEK